MENRLSRNMAIAAFLLMTQCLPLFGPSAVKFSFLWARQNQQHSHLVATVLRP